MNKMTNVYKVYTVDTRRQQSIGDIILSNITSKAAFRKYVCPTDGFGRKVHF